MLRCSVLFYSEVNKPQTRQGSGNSPRKCCPKERKKERKGSYRTATERGGKQVFVKKEQQLQTLKERKERGREALLS